MKKMQTISRLGWLGLFLYSFKGLTQAPAAVAWLLASLATLVPLLISIALNSPNWDRSFFGIVVVSLCIVSVAVCLGQWAVLDASPASLGIVPVLSLILWFVHERVNRQNRP